jgi:hypothetical protein
LTRLPPSNPQHHHQNFNTLIENTAAYYQQNACSEEERQGQRQTHSKMAILKEKLVTYLNIEDDSSSKHMIHFGCFCV